MENKTAASPTYLGEYNFDQFKRIARPGQIWQTSNSMLRIDRLAGNIMTRRLSKFMKFFGAYTGTSPRALRSLMPQKNGKFLSSSGPWTVSRKYEPFLLLKTNVFEFDPGQADFQEPVDTTESPVEPFQEPNSAQERPQLDLNLEDSPDFAFNLPSIKADLAGDMAQSETLAALIGACQTAYREFDSTWAMHPGHDRLENLAFDIKVGRLDIPDFVRQALSEDELSAEYDTYTEYTIGNYLAELPQKFKWVYEPFITGRSGGWLEVPVRFSVLFDDAASEYTPGQDANDFIDSVVYYFAGESVVDIDTTMWNSLDGTTQKEIVDLLYDLPPALKTANKRLHMLFNDVEKNYQHFIHDLESPEFWNEIIRDRRLAQEAELKSTVDIEF